MTSTTTALFYPLTVFRQELAATEDSGRVMLGAGMRYFSVPDRQVANHARRTHTWVAPFMRDVATSQGGGDPMA